MDVFDVMVVIRDTIVRGTCYFMSFKNKNKSLWPLLTLCLSKRDTVVRGLISVMAVKRDTIVCVDFVSVMAEKRGTIVRGLF